MKIPFTKMQAFGNDYVYISTFGLPELDWNDLARKVSNRHFGIGSDGMVLICPSEEADFRMRIFNPDGSEAEMCGNAIRSTAKYVYDHGMTDKTEFRIETLGGIKNLYLTVEDGKAVNIEAEIGKPIFDAESVPVLADGKEELFNQPVEIEAGGKTCRLFLSALSWGNPHTVLLWDDLDSLDIETIGPAIEKAAIFPKKTNVTFAKALDRKNIAIREWERNCGETIGCGTGCSAALVFLNRLGLADKQATVHQIGGDLEILWDEEGLVHMKGPSHLVFEGEYIYENQ